MIEPVVSSACGCIFCSFFFFFNDTATTEIYTLSLHDALPISETIDQNGRAPLVLERDDVLGLARRGAGPPRARSEEHTSELQSHLNLVCRLLLEKKKAARRRPSRSQYKTLGPLVSASEPITSA